MNFSKILQFILWCKENLVLFCVICSVLGAVVVSAFLFRRNQNPKIVLNSASGTADQGEDKTLDFEKIIAVDLSGAVERPGVYMLPDGSRVSDLISLGGGIRSDSSLDWVSKHLNLSQKLTDSQKVYVPFEWDVYVEGEPSTLDFVSESYGGSNGTSSSFETGVKDASDQSNGTSPSESTAVATSNKINVNSASVSELDTLYGIGPAYAQRIVASRPYKNIEEFRQKSKIPASTVDKIKDQIAF